MSKSQIGLFAGAALFFSAQVALAHPGFTPGTCRILQRNDRLLDALDLDNAEALDFTAPLLRIGDTTIVCKADLGPGQLMVFNFATTGDTCELGPEFKPVAKTKDWTETIKPNGEATLTCRFGPR